MCGASSGCGERSRTDPWLRERIGPTCAWKPGSRAGEAIVAHRQRQEMELDVRVAHTGAAADEAAGLEVIAAAEPAAGQQPAGADQRPAPRRHLPIEGHRFAARHLEVGIERIL